MADHTCACPACDLELPAADVAAGRQGEGHVAVRFGDAPLGRWRITLDGADVTSRCVEAMAGRWPWGFVVLLSQPLHPCARRCGEACHEQIWGHVTVRREFDDA